MINAAVDRRPFRSRVLLECGAPEALLPELLEYNERPFVRDGGSGPQSLPLRDEPHLQAWAGYEAHARAVGALAALRERFFQLQFPIREGISQDELYRRATLRGQGPGPGEAEPLALNRPQDLQLVLNPTPAGRVPLLIVPDRADFIALVRAFSGRNEPIPVPDSMGACIVSGLNNWDRVARYRERWQQEQPFGGSWEEEFKRMIPRKELYQDRFIILSTGPYSFVSAAASGTGLPDAEWLKKSLVIRREHECTHYLMYRVIGSMKNNLQDEVIADFVGLIHAFGYYSAELALRFFGLENYPAYREGGRLQTYCVDPPLSEPAVAVVRTLVHRTANTLESLAQAYPERLRGTTGITRMAIALSELTLEELASRDMYHLLEERWNYVPHPITPPAGPSDSLWIRVGNTDDGMGRLLQEFDGFVTAHPRLEAVRGDLSLALDEIVSNVIHHGYDHGECADGHEHLILVGVTVHPEQVEVEIVDDAKCFSPVEAAQPDTEQPLEERRLGGLGIHLVRSLMDGMDYRRQADKNHLNLRKNLPPS
jgi:anti-sigma regulatory factor (Ser/Thr protein kinase)